VIISPIQWADRKVDGAKDEAKSAKEVPAILSNYPSLTEQRRNERYNFWRSLCKREAGEEEASASLPEQGQEGEWQPLNTEAAGLPKFL
jgi:cobalamin biosynthesis protein CobT